MNFLVQDLQILLCMTTVRGVDSNGRVRSPGKSGMVAPGVMFSKGSEICGRIENMNEQREDVQSLYRPSDTS